jgi:glycosyltransferase involved in cell wall biosynthesis
VLAGVATVHAIVNARPLAHPQPDSGEPLTSRAAILLPVRNEAYRVEPCLRSLLVQPGELLVLDDKSTDATADVVRSVGGARIRLLSGAPRPAGWLGKPFACHQLASATDADVLVFVDADVVLAPGAIEACTRLPAGFDLASPYPRMVAEGLGQRLIQPLLQLSWLNLDSCRDPDEFVARIAAACGGAAADDWRRLWRRAARVSDASWRDVLTVPRDTPLALARLGLRVGDLAAVAPGRTLSGLSRCMLGDPRLRMLLDRYATYAGADPRRAPAALWRSRTPSFTMVAGMCGVA